MINVFIADDSEHIRLALRRFLAGDSRFHVAGEAQTYDETLRFAPALKPDIILADVRMPGARAGEAELANLVAACQCPVIVMSFTADAESAFLAASVGAARLLDKTRLYEHLIPAIQEVLAEHRA